ncbi:phenylalanine--tRNA ligase subunit alpha, partial [Gallibacterium anatis]|nr:phenylalanine--tRNA ligase subunit alpha [Gallibacterium anatis]MDK9561607.1 phenylalanine--tRNA ligase subunit alpha [Gallibacterium anatis]
MQNLEQITEQALAAIAAAQDGKALEAIRVEYFGKKGPYTLLMQGLRDLSAEERPAMGAKINEAKQTAQSALNAKKAELEEAELNAKLAKERIDVTLPGRKLENGGLHPVTLTIERVVK